MRRKYRFNHVSEQAPYITEPFSQESNLFRISLRQIQWTPVSTNTQGTEKNGSY